MLTKRQTLFLFAVFFVSVVLWFVWAKFGVAIVGSITTNNSVETVGQWGDTFGGLNVIFGAAGTCLVLATLLAQRTALRDQQIDLHKQRFESSFFQLLGLLRELKGQKLGNKLDPEGMIITEAAKKMSLMLNSDVLALAPDARTNLAAHFITYVHNAFEIHLSPYFRIVYTILRRIHDDPILNEKEKIDYGNLLRSQLTTDEVILCALNGLTPASKDFAKYLTEFRILKYLPEGTPRQAFMKLYPDKAFQGRD